MEQMLFDIADFDPCIRKARGNANSAANKPNKAWQQGAILAQLSKGNFTCKEIARRLGVEQNVISGRFYEMRNAGLIRLMGERRMNAGVYELCK